MASETTKATAPKKTRKAKPVETIDFSKPFFTTVRQAPSRLVIEVHQGEQGRDDALKSAAKQAESGKTTTAVFGPALAVFNPPAPPKAQKVDLAWNTAVEADTPPDPE